MTTTEITPDRWLELRDRPAQPPGWLAPLIAAGVAERRERDRNRADLIRQRDHALRMYAALRRPRPAPQLRPVLDLLAPARLAVAVARARKAAKL